MSEGEQNWKYILILKDDFSSFVRLSKKHCTNNSIYNAAADEPIGGAVPSNFAEYRGQNPHSRQSCTANRV